MRKVKLHWISDRFFWFGTFSSQVRREADLLINSHGPLAYRYARDHVRLAELRRRRRDVTLYKAVASEIAARSPQLPPTACGFGAAWLPDWLPPVHATVALLA